MPGSVRRENLKGTLHIRHASSLKLVFYDKLEGYYGIFLWHRFTQNTQLNGNFDDFNSLRHEGSDVGKFLIVCFVFSRHLGVVFADGP